MQVLSTLLLTFLLTYYYIEKIEEKATFNKRILV